MKPRVLVILGPTASGKSALAMALAESHGGEIISLDSAQVYRELNIGTAKPTPEEQRRVPHHLIDLIDPTEVYSASRFIEDAQRAIHGIAARGRLPILVGGTMLYYKALIDGLHDMPAAHPAIRSEILARAAVEGWPALHRELQQIDPLTAERLAPNDSQRIERALEVFFASGETLSAWHAKQSTYSPDFTPHAIALIPEDRAQLHAQIAKRFQSMVSQGLLAELHAVRQHYPELSPDSPAMRMVGYRQAWQGLDGKLSEIETLEKGIFATRQLAKRQLTWLRGWGAGQSMLLLDPFQLTFDDCIERIQNSLGQSIFSAK